jgi:SAM-dependent methyltransferase
VDVSRSLRPRLWTQSFPFSCGPSALGSVLEALGWSPGRRRSDEELEIWRESTAVACPGTHPWGLALAAARRGFLVEVRTAGPRPWLWRHIRRQHRFLALRQYRAIETSLARGCRQVGVRLRRGSLPPEHGEAGLLLTHARSRALHDVDPHWVGLVPVEGSIIVLDPLRAREYRSDRSVRDWWEDSGFDGTKSWVAVRPAKGPGAPRTDEAGESDRPSRSAPEHAHKNHLARRGWSRAEGLAWLESPDRRSTEDPEEVWTRVGLKPGETVVEVGAGTGYFAMSAAHRVGASGRVYAVDVSRELIELLHERRGKAALPQLIPVRSTPESIPLDSGIADVLLLANVLHDIPSATISEAVRLLRRTGRAVNVDWKKEDTPGGPPLEIRMTPAEAAALLAKHGLELTERWELGPWHYGLTLRPIEDENPSSARRRS